MKYVDIINNLAHVLKPYPKYDTILESEKTKSLESIAHKTFRHKAETLAK
jgi:hypothetical protein